ncbi:ROK family protein, partial [Streptomyces sp. S12]|nr:ROK family protein [Streptomyces sp. S12]
GNAGHIGHISVDLDGDPCPCGARGCGPGQRLAAGPRRRQLRRAAAARAGDPVAVASFERAARALAAGIAATATLVEIDIAVIGGGVAKAGEVLLAPLRRALTEYATLSFVQRLAVVPARMGTDAGLVGAAAAALARRADTAVAGV